MEKHDPSSSENPNPQPWKSYNTVYTTAKAGMGGVDKERVQKIVYEMSKGSKYFENEEKKEAVMRQKVENMRGQFAMLTPSELSHYQKVADGRILELEARRDLTRIWLHVDMDAFYAAVETLADPKLKGKPMAVGGMSMISTANYEARKFGVRAAMPGFIARKLCPELIFVPTDFKKYNHYSALTREVFQKYDPNFLAASLDEAYLDITDVCKERGITGGEVAEELRAGVFEATGLTCSAGVAPNRLLAKVCSDINKPNGQFVLPNDRMAVVTFISSLPIRKIGGIGKVTEHLLKEIFAMNTCEALLQKSGLLFALFSPSTAEFFISVGLGLGKTDSPEVTFRKSISNERTFSATDDKAFIFQKLVLAQLFLLGTFVRIMIAAEIAEILCADMQKEGLSGRTLTLKLKTASFEIRNRAVTLQRYISSTEDILEYASKLLKAELPLSLRLIGLRVSHFFEDKVGGTPDRTQKTLNSFIISDVSKKRLGDESSMGSDISNQHLMDVSETAFSTDTNEIQHYGSTYPLSSNCLHDLEDHQCSLDNNEVGEINESLRNTVEDKMNPIDVAGYDPESLQTKVPQLDEAESSLCGQLRNSSDRTNEFILDDEADGLLEHKEQLLWVDGYKCSQCGIEMPPNFLEERQEHSDFHLAERLQKMESIIEPRTSMPRERSVQKTPISKQNGRKKMKLSSKEAKDRSHIPIDAFFAKSNQNF